MTTTIITVQIYKLKMTANICPLQSTEPKFLELVYSALLSVKNTKISYSGDDCIAIFRNEDLTDFGFAVRRTKDVKINDYWSKERQDIKIKAILTLKY